MSKMIMGLCAFVMLVITPSVHADPVVITSGSLTVVGISGSPSYSISGVNFSATATGGDPGNTPNCLPCASGTPISLSSFLVGTSLGDGTATINGTTFNNVGFLGQFSFGVNSIVLPVGTTNLTIMAPFVFSGDIRGCDGNALICTTEVFSTTQLVGQGIAIAQFEFGSIVNGVALYSFKSITYQFQSAEIPEPMTIMLLASGLLGVGATLKSRRKHLL